MTDAARELLIEIPEAKAYLREVERRLKPKLVRHSTSVAVLMADLAQRLRLPAHEAVAAGLLHDLGKGMGEEELLERATRYGIPVTDTQRAKPKLLHGPVAAEISRRELDIPDLVHEAIWWHTTGRPGLNLLGQALYFADYAEPLRDYPGSAIARSLLDTEGFSSALLFVSGEKLARARLSPPLDLSTEAFHAWLIEGSA